MWVAATVVIEDPDDLIVEPGEYTHFGPLVHIGFAAQDANVAVSCRTVPSRVEFDLSLAALNKILRAIPADSWEWLMDGVVDGSGNAPRPASTPLPPQKTHLDCCGNTVPHRKAHPESPES